jgi:hypothetical protein
VADRLERVLQPHLEILGFDIPYQWRHSPFESGEGVQGIMNIPAVFILIVLSLLLIRGTRESAFVNGIIVITKCDRPGRDCGRLGLYQPGQPQRRSSRADHLRHA